MHLAHELNHGESSLKLDESRVKKPVGFLHPTQGHYEISHNINKTLNNKVDSQPSSSDADGEDSQDATNATYKWTSRNDRKGRHALVIKGDGSNDYQTPPSSMSLSTISRTILKMFIYYPVWDVSWLVAFVFTWGSICWVVNAFFDFLPYLQPSTTFPGEQTAAAGWSAFVGATIFEVGSVLLMLEAINTNSSSCFGWAIEQVFEEEFEHGGANETGAKFRIRPDLARCSHHHTSRIKPEGEVDEKEMQARKAWIWYPSWHDLTTRYIHELGFLASLTQLFAATVFWISGFTAIPQILNSLSTSATNGAYWVPQVIGGLGFIVSGFLFMLETQDHWWKPAPKTLGWHIGVWNCIGGWGFFLCPCFGFDTAYWSTFQSSCSTFWGSWAFLIGSVIQLYESLNKSPVEVQKTGKDKQ